MAIDIAVLGSCVSRDLFNSKFNSNYKQFYQCVLTQNQTSIISLMSQPVSYKANPEDNLSPYQEWNVRTDLSKEFLHHLKQKQPKFLMIDFFADVHFGCLQVGTDQMITDNRWMVHKTSYYKALMEAGQARRITLQDDTQEYFDLWTQAVDQLFQFLQAEVPDCKVILHQARNVDDYVTESGEKKRLSESGRVYPVDVDYLNHLWDRLDDYVLRHYTVYSMNLFHDALTSHEEHPWGPFYLHYPMEYYRDCLNELHRIVLKDEMEVRQNDFFFNLLSDLSRSDVQKTTVIRTKVEEVKTYQRQIHADNGTMKSSLVKRSKRLLKQKIIEPLQHTYQKM